MAMKKMNTKQLRMLALIILAVAIVAWTSTGFISQKCSVPSQETEIQVAVRIITPQEAYALIQDNKDDPNFIILDVRTPEEFEEEHLKNSININFRSETFKDELSRLDKAKTYLVYCRTSVRSGAATEIMKELGFEKVYDMSGGIVQWKAKELPTVK